MPVGKNSQQIPVVLPRVIVELLEEDSSANITSRSVEAKKIIINHYKNTGRITIKGKSITRTEWKKPQEQNSCGFFLASVVL